MDAFVFFGQEVHFTLRKNVHLPLPKKYKQSYLLHPGFGRFRGKPGMRERRARLHFRDVLLLENHLDEHTDEHGEEGEGDEDLGINSYGQGGAIVKETPCTYFPPILYSFLRQRITKNINGENANDK